MRTIKQWQRQDVACGHPVYTICFYHGTEAWDGPRSLKDMMRYEGKTGAWRECFQDYGMRLFCAGEPDGLEGFQTELKQLLMALSLREDKEAMYALWSREEFSHLDRETVETLAIMTDSTEILNRITEYEEDGGYSMCKAMRELKSDWRAEGIARGMEQGIVVMIDNIMEKLSYSLEEACKIAGKPPEEYQQIKQELSGSF